MPNWIYFISIKNKGGIRFTQVVISASLPRTNPIFVLVDDEPVRPSRRSAEWCRKAVDQCWKMKLPRIRESEQAAAKEAYDHARQVYDRIIQESMPD